MKLRSGTCVHCARRRSNCAQIGNALICAACSMDAAAHFRNLQPTRYYPCDSAPPSAQTAAAPQPSAASSAPPPCAPPASSNTSVTTRTT